MRTLRPPGDVTLWFEAYGCTANQGETHELAARARALGHPLAASADEADTVVLGTCTVIAATQQRMEQRIAALRAAGKRVIIGGCMATADRQRLRARFPDAPLLAPGDTAELAPLLGPPEDGAPAGGDARPGSDALSGGDAKHADAGRADCRTSAPVSAILNIASGCLGRCTYCATLRARGWVRSRPVAEVVARARAALAAGSRELLLTSQDNAAYGADNGESLAALLTALRALPGDFRLRVGMLNPALAAPEADALAAAWDDPRVYRFLHLPLQSGSQTMLDAMGRGHTLADFQRVVDAFRSRHPGLMLATDVIAGFPGESDADHRATLALLQRLEPVLVYITRFSPRDGTPAARMPHRVASGVAKERSRELTRLRQVLGRRRFARLKDSRRGVLAVERRKPGSTLCRDDGYHPIVVAGELPLGVFHTVEITDAHWAYACARTLGNAAPE